MKSGIIAGIAICLTWLAPNASHGQAELPGERLGALPEPIANNAVAAVTVGGHTGLYSFSGLGSGKTHADTSSRAYVFDMASRASRRLPDVPGGKGRLASVAVALGGKIYLFGGYTVAEDGGEVSTPEVFAFDPAGEAYARVADMPLPVDDSVALPFAGRYIYLVSGWHDTGNVNAVQVYDTEEDAWFRATDYPGPAVFGHAGGIVGRSLVIADGVAVLGEEDGRRKFGAVNAAYLGRIDPEDPALIVWSRLPSHDGPPLYRMAATGHAGRNFVIFTGGSANPYNYNGIGYNGEASAPSDRVFAFSLGARRWIELGAKPMATMDHRGLIATDGKLITLGGMTGGQTIAADVFSFSLP